MALKSTIFKAELQVADLDRAHYGDYSLTIARHPSETDERMMIRLLAFALFATETLAFGRGLSSEDEADLQDVDLTGRIDRWIEVGLPDEKALRKACHRATEVAVVAYGSRTTIWWQQVAPQLAMHENLYVLAVAPADSQALAQLVTRTMRLQCTLQEGTIWLGDADRQIELAPRVLFAMRKG